ncbi:MAG: ATP-binding protein [Halobacteriota archaeon]
MRIKHRFVLVFVVVTIVSAATLFVIFDTTRAGTVDDIETSVEDRSVHSASLIAERIDGQSGLLAAVSDNPELRRHGSDAQRRALDTFLDTSRFDGASIVDSDGTMVWIAGVDDDTRRATIGRDYSDRQYVRAALSGDRHVSEPFEAATGNHVVVISVPLYHVNGSVAGTLNGAYHLTGTNLFDPIVDDDARTAITVRSGDSVLFTNADRFEETIAHTTEIESLGWTVTAHYSTAAATADLRQLALGQLLTAVVLLGTVTGFGAWVYRSEIRHVDRLRTRIDALERRAYDDDTSLGGSAEWRRIDAALDRLASNLARREQMLLVLNRFLRHNLRNQLNLVLGHAADLEADAETDTQRTHAAVIQDATEDVLAAAERARVTEDLLERPPDERLQPVDLVALLDERVAVAESAHPDLSVSLSVPDSALVRGGPQLSIVIDELLDNVAEHAGDDPVAHIDVTAGFEETVLVIRDDGPGITETERELIVGRSQITQLRHASGFGLWFVRWIVTRFDGDVSIETDNGTVITVRLPSVVGSSDTGV